MPSVDLTTLPGWASLSTGSHNITIVARADGYRDSDSFTINGTTYKGEYSNPINVVNSNITVESYEYYEYGVDVTFNFSET